MTAAATSCVAVLGGSFDPVHHAHLALAGLFASLLAPAQLRIVPAGRPWQKGQLGASNQDRVAMLELAFRDFPIPVVIDQQEITRERPSYSVETLRALRAELGPQAAIVFLMGADQLRNLDTWHDWRELFTLANLGVATRPGYAIDAAALPAAVATELAARQAAPETVRASACGKICLAPTLAVDISATQIRAARREGRDAGALVPLPVLDYIQQHNLYKI